MIKIISKILFIIGIGFFIATATIWFLNDYKIVVVANFESILAGFFGFACLLVLPNTYIKYMEEESESGMYSVGGRKLCAIFLMAGVFFLSIAFK